MKRRIQPESANADGAGVRIISGISRTVVLVVMVVLTFRLAGAQKPIARVADIQGEWYFSAGNNPEEKLAQWQRLPLDGAIRVKAPSSQDYIVIVGMDDRVLEERRCSDISACNRPIYVTQSSQEADGKNGVISKLWERLWSDPERYSMHRQRDLPGENAHTTEGVIALRAGLVELANIMAGLTSGRYHLYFLRKASDTTSDQPIGPVDVNWHSASPVSVPVRDLKAGLYETGLLSRGTADEPFKRTGRAAWALVCAGKDYREAAASFKEAVKVTNNWGQRVSPETTLSFLRAELAELADASCKP